MQVRNTLLRISIVLGKTIVGLLAVLVIVLLIIHIPAVQRRITPSVSDYLSSKVQSRVEIENIYFALTGKVSIHGLKVWDPAADDIFTSGDIEVNTNIFNLIRGNLIFDEIRITGISGKLIQLENGLNIQFIIDAFQPPTSQTRSTAPAGVYLQFKKVVLEDITFAFTSRTNGTTVSTHLGRFDGENIEISINPNKISANTIYLENTVTQVVYKARLDTMETGTTSEERSLFATDFGSGFDYDIGDIEFKDNHLSLHRDSVSNTPKFDPDHINLENISLNLSEIKTDSISLAAALHSISVQLPGFKLLQTEAEIQMTPDVISVSKLNISSTGLDFSGEIKGGYEKLSDKKDANINIDATGSIDPQALSYFVSDSIMKYFAGWKTSEITLKGNYSKGKGEFEKLKLISGTSALEVRGIVYDVLDQDNLSWKQTIARVTLGTEFRNTITPFIKAISLPPDASIELTSAGNLKEISFDGKVSSGWGNLATGGIARQPLDNLTIDAVVDAKHFYVGKLLDLPWIGPVDANAHAKGSLTKDFNLKASGTISSVEIIEKAVQDITFETTVTEDSVVTIADIGDSTYRSFIRSEVSLTQSVLAKNEIRFKGFSAGKFLDQDSLLIISGAIKSTIRLDENLLEASAESDSLSIANQTSKYFIDTLAFKGLLSPEKSNVTYYTNNGYAELESNFDIREAMNVVDNWSSEMLKSETEFHSSANRTAQIDMGLKDPDIFQLLGIDVDDFSSLHVTGQMDEQKGTATLLATTGDFKGYGLTLDTLNAVASAIQKEVNVDLDITNLFYNSIDLGNLNFDIVTERDSSKANLIISHDSVTTLGLPVVILRADSGYLAFADKVTAFDRQYAITQENPLYLEKNRVLADNLTISGGDMKISLDGNKENFIVDLQKVNLVPLNELLFPDTAVINSGILSGKISYSQDKQFNLRANIDSLRLYNSEALAITANAVSDKAQVPFDFLLTNTSNKIELYGNYFLADEQVDASLNVDVNNLEIFSFLISDIVAEMSGAIKGKATIKGKPEQPNIKGQLRLVDVDLTTANPQLDFKVKDDIILLDSSALLFNKFTIYDRKSNPLVINGKIATNNYQSFAYNLRLNSDQYYLIDNPDSSKNTLRGSLVVASDVKLKGNEKDTDVDANITIKDATKLTAVSSSDDIELLKSEGIIVFVDPALWMDTTLIAVGSSFYDSLIASLPDFNLNSTIKIEPNATLSLIVDEQSGDYAQSSGDGSLELGYDRTGNIRLSGTYTIKKGLYRVSFYDLVKKSFTLVPGSSITWSGDPEDGALDIKAQYTVETNSIGLIGHEIGENEKSIYKRALDYEVGIIIKGTIEKPMVSFSLDLPEREKANYPVLANKLDRLRQPEYASELNKQVFGLLVLGGFLPETGADVNQNVIATTAISNSVNSLLANQLNRFASQYVKGVNIDVGIQSYSDYSAPGGKTRTAMDFRVSKSIMNDRLSFEVGGDFDINADQSGANTGKNYRGDIAIIYDLTGGGDKQLKLFNNETYDIVYQEIRNTGISLIFIREFSGKKELKNKDK
jgi:hypothetical protein